MSENSTLSPSKPRYEILDGLRGVAAIIVLLYHHFEVFVADPIARPCNHGYLAVDFFFILSGFVIGYSYDDRWKSRRNPEGKMGLWDFFRRRLIRLHPMIIFATLYCAAFFYLGWSDVFPLIQGVTPWKLLLLCLFSIFMIPCPVGLDIRGWQETNPINGNAWTLYFEYLANILYALVIRHFPKWLLAVFVALSAVLTLDLTLNLDLFGFLAGRNANAFTVIGGWSMTGQEQYVGFSRLLFPFFGGLLLSKIITGKGAALKSIPGNGFLWASVLLATVLVMPHLGGTEKPLYNGIYEAVSILVLFPLTVLMGACGTVSGKSAKVCRWLGEISYPLYITHYAMIFGVVNPWHFSHPEASVGQLVVLSAGSVAVSIFVAWAAFKLYDEPVRRFLKRSKFNRNRKKKDL